MEATRVLVFFALREEAGAFKEAVRGRAGVAYALTGIGRENAERVARQYLDRLQPAQVLTCGFAGGLNPHLTAETVVFETEDERLRGRLMAAGGRPGRFHCAGRIAVTAAEKAQLYRQTGADAVEMESAVIHTLCWDRKIPVATVRAISDTAGEDLPLDFNHLSKPDKSLDLPRLITYVIRRPRLISPLLQLQKRAAASAQRLAGVLEQVTRG
jgi:adenosylhomocysteine nucleosidase